jgi:hypothetical protein
VNVSGRRGKGTWEDGRVRLDLAIDLYLGDLARQGKAWRTRDDYRRKLLPLCGAKKVVEPPQAHEIGPNECRRHLDRWIDSAPGTRYHHGPSSAGSSSGSTAKGSWK